MDHTEDMMDQGVSGALPSAPVSTWVPDASEMSEYLRWYARDVADRARSDLPHERFLAAADLIDELQGSIRHVLDNEPLAVRVHEGGCAEENLGASLAITMQRMKAPISYLIWSNEHRAWWAPDRCGYTTSIERAGRYERTEAIAIAGTARGGWWTGRNPDEIAIPEADAIEQATNPNRCEAWANSEGK